VLPPRFRLDAAAIFPRLWRLVRVKGGMPVLSRGALKILFPGFPIPPIAGSTIPIICQRRQ